MIDRTMYDVTDDEVLASPEGMAVRALLRTRKLAKAKELLLGQLAEVEALLASTDAKRDASLPMPVPQPETALEPAIATEATEDASDPGIEALVASVCAEPPAPAVAKEPVAKAIAGAARKVVATTGRDAVAIQPPPPPLVRMAAGRARNCPVSLCLAGEIRRVLGPPPPSGGEGGGDMSDMSEVQYARSPEAVESCFDEAHEIALEAGANGLTGTVAVTQQTPDRGVVLLWGVTFDPADKAK